MATSFTKAALGAEGVGKDIDMVIGNGYAKGHAETALTLGDRQYQALVECLPTPACSFDTEHRFVFANWAAADAFEVEAKNLLGRSLHEFVSEEDWDLILRRTSDLHDGGIRPYDISIIRPDGTTRSVSVHAALRHNSDGTTTGVVMALQAATEHRTVERALQESEE